MLPVPREVVALHLRSRVDERKVAFARGRASSEGPTRGGRKVLPCPSAFAIFHMHAA